MPVGFPTKVNYATGDVLSATNMNDLSGTVNLLEGTQSAAAKNFLINGGFDIFQRGVSATQNAFSADRWYGTTASGTATYARESTIKPVDAQYSLKLTQTATSTTFINQAIETSNAILLAGKTVTYSYEAATSSTVNVTPFLYFSTSTDVGVTGSWTVIAATTISSTSVNGTASFQKISATYSVPSTAKSVMVGIGINLTASLTAYVAKAQLEIGSSGSAFARAGGTIQGELAACQRYYYRVNGVDGYLIATGQCFSTTGALATIPYPVNMRIRPTALEQSGTANLYRVLNSAATAVVCSAVPVFANGTVANAAVTFTVASGLTAGNATIVGFHAVTEGYLGWSAEL
jgi:hypothetical protein